MPAGQIPESAADQDGEEALARNGPAQLLSPSITGPQSIPVPPHRDTAQLKLALESIEPLCVLGNGR